MIAQDIAGDLGVDAGEVALIARTANKRYKRYRIAKRTGGWRTIDHPSQELKYIQEWINEKILSQLPVHPAVYSYRAGIGIDDHARQHSRSAFLLRADFVNFFPSISRQSVRRLLQQNRDRIGYEINSNDINLICSLVCKDDRLTIGAPTSPALSNAILYEFDRFWFDAAKELEVKYTRYADDLYFSTKVPNTLAGLLVRLRADLRNREVPRLKLNEKKTIFTSRKTRRLVTGIVITPEAKISIGRERKRYVKGLIHRYLLGFLKNGEFEYLRGMLSYINSVEPTFIRALEKKYNKSTIMGIRKGASVARIE
jgi:RNA-directed DNA polymerase